ncbi:MAG: Gldg family protein, partial [Hymenobacteraceae bacterium]|nr:Gldg family protein [Hymenobacteraceae bacterium]
MVTVQNKSKRSTDILQFFAWVAGIILLNLLAASYFFRLDLTEDKRYTIAPVTKQMLGSLEQEVVVDVYLEGDFPAGFKRLQQSVREMLDEFRIYAGGNLRYNFIDPNEISDEKQRTEFYTTLAQKGITPTNLRATEEGKQVERLVFPGAIVRY